MRGDPIRVFVPGDSAARAVGADEVARAIATEARARGLNLAVVRNGSRGLYWLEPLVEVEVAGEPGGPPRRIGFGPVGPGDVGSLLDAGFQHDGRHPLAIGDVDRHPWLARQERLVFGRLGRTDPLSLADYAATDGWVGLRRALALQPAEVVAEVTDSGLRGRGGAAFPTGIKWRTVLEAPTRVGRHGVAKYIVCNADEGDSGTFSDRLSMEGDPFGLIEGMTIAGLATGATQGYVYIRSEYPDAFATMDAAIRHATDSGFLGADILGSGRTFRLEARMGAGSYVCGEETALLDSLEGKRGIVRAKPPLPALQGLFGQPTVINNVITFASVPLILARGAAFYRDFGVGRSTGTLPFQLAGNIRRGGLVEKAFGLTLRELVEDFGGGTRSGRPIKAIQVGGPLGTYIAPEHWDSPLDYEAYAAFGGVLGHGGIVVHDDSADMAQLARYAMEFCAIESCGKCTPCRIGSTRGVEVIDRLVASEPGSRKHEDQVRLLRDLCDTMQYGSLCAMGGMTPVPVRSALEHYPGDFHLPVESDRQRRGPGTGRAS